ncbi:hypothetical protein BMA2003 [Burkholderia mallei ATCC 23344]|uniref:Uncharacterized protein n=2 Tax=Burkholderia mallei TaxID=13373 RepID=A0A0H2WKR7_BURMA|nr:hypothetical protein BMA2003 [Burkholderia mallei ATCC 23344]
MPPRFAFRLTTLHQGRVPLSDRNAPRHYFGSAPTSVATVDETGASGFDAAAVDFDDDTLRFGSDATTAPTDEPSELTTELVAAAPVVSSEPADAAALPNAALPDVKTLPAEAAPEPISAEPTLPSCEAVATPVPAAPVNAPATPPIAAAGLVPATVAIVLAALFAALVSAPAGLATGSAATRPPIAPATGVPFAARASVPATVFAAAVSAAGLATESAFARPLATLVMGVIGLLPIAFASVPTTLFTTPGNGLLLIAPEIAPAAVLPAPASAPVTLPAAPVSAPEPLLAAPANAPATLLSAPGRGLLFARFVSVPTALLATPDSGLFAAAFCSVLAAFASVPVKLSSATLLIDASAEPSALAWIEPCCVPPASASMALPDPAPPRSVTEAETGSVSNPAATAGVAAATPNATAADNAMLVNLKFCFISDLVWMGTAVVTAPRSPHGTCQHAHPIDRAPFSPKKQTLDEFICQIHRTNRIVDRHLHCRYGCRNVTAHSIPLHSHPKPFAL